MKKLKTSQVKNKIVVRKNIDSSIDERRRQVKELVLVRKHRAGSVAKKLGVPVTTIYSDLKVIRQKSADIIVGENSPGDTVLTDTIMASEERLRVLWNMLKLNEEKHEEIFGGINYDLATDEKSLNSDYAKAILTYEKNIRDIMKSIRDEEDHQMKTLQKFGVISNTKNININKNVVSRDDTPIVSVIADFINNEIKDPSKKLKLRNKLVKHLKRLDNEAK